MVGKVRPIELEEHRGVKIERIASAPRTESIVRFPVTLESPRVGIIQKYELEEGVFGSKFNQSSERLCDNEHP
jgi:hypothetical protein